MNPTIEPVVRVIAERCGLTVEDILGVDRHKGIAEARKVAMYVVRCYVKPTPSYPVIGREFKRDHTTVMSAVSGIEKLRTKNEWVEALVTFGRAEAARLEREWRAELAKCGLPEALNVGAAE